MARYYYHTDPGHGWLQVHIADLAPLNLTVQSFTRYSYTREDYLFLEEDEDAGIFMRAYEAKHGEEPEIVTVPCDVPHVIRSYTHLRAT